MPEAAHAAMNIGGLPLAAPYKCLPCPPNASVISLPALLISFPLLSASFAPFLNWLLSWRTGTAD